MENNGSFFVYLVSFDLDIMGKSGDLNRYISSNGKRLGLAAYGTT